MVVQGALGESHYLLGATTFPATSLTRDALIQGVTRAGLQVLGWW